MKRLTCATWGFIFFMVCLVGNIEGVVATEVPEREYTIEVQTSQGSEEIHIVERGVGEPRIIVFHGMTSYNHYYHWDPLLSVSEGKIILAGLPGHGPVKHYPRSHYYQWTVQHFIDVAVKIIQKYGKGRPLTLIGHSSGGWVALGVTVQKPELVDRLILVAPVVWNQFKGDSEILSKISFFPPLARFFTRMAFKPAWKSPRGHCELLSGCVGNKKDFCRNKSRMEWVEEQYNYVHKTMTLDAMVDVCVGVSRLERKIDLRPMIREKPFNIPTLIIHGKKDPVIPLEQSKWLKEALPQAELIVIPEVGHLIFIEDEEMFYDKLLPWYKAKH